MPSFKSVLTAFALTAVAAVSAHESHSPEIRALARAAVAKRAINRRHARADPASVFNSAAFAATPLSEAAATVACNNTQTCTDNVPIPANTNFKAVCLAAACRIRCADGFVPVGGTPPSACIPDEESCTKINDDGSIYTNALGNPVITQCPKVVGGYTSCNAHGTVCYIRCPKAWSKTQNADGSWTCHDIYHDPTYCGIQGTVCPTDYNGLPGSSAVCRHVKGQGGVCSLSCPAGTTAVATTSTTKPFACA